MKLSSNTIILLAGILLIIIALIYMMMGKKAPIYSPEAQAPSEQYNVSADLKELNSTDPNSLNSDLQELDKESSSL